MHHERRATVPVAHELQEIGERLEQPPRPNDIGAASDLHRRPDFAVGVEHISGGNEQDDEQQHALSHHND